LITHGVDLQDWANSRRGVADGGGRRADRTGDGLRFVFYGRTSTVEFQDQVSSRAWQREVAESVVADCGRIVGEFFDAGWSRRLAWADRPQAAALLAALADPDRGFEAIVVGEYERAFFAEPVRRAAAG
jgi:hypothetical protein